MLVTSLKGLSLSMSSRTKKARSTLKSVMKSMSSLSVVRMIAASSVSPKKKRTVRKSGVHLKKVRLLKVRSLGALKVA